jgi:hypothetical protein
MRFLSFSLVLFGNLLIIPLKNDANIALFPKYPVLASSKVQSSSVQGSIRERREECVPAKSSHLEFLRFGFLKNRRLFCYLCPRFTYPVRRVEP